MVVAVDLLTTVDRVKLMLGQALVGTSTGTTSDFFLNMLITQVSNEITKSCNRTHFLIGNGINPITAPYSGSSTEWLCLNQWPVYTPILAGDTTSGSAVITNLPSTTGLFANQSVTGLAFAQPVPPASQPSPIPPLYIVSVDNSTQVTVSGTANLTATQTPIGFGVGVWWNNYGYGGSVSGAFQLANMIGEGTAYWIDRDQPDGTSKSGMLGSMYGPWCGTWGYYWPDLAPTQAPGPGNYQVQATFGYASVPPDLEMAAIWAVIKARWMRNVGMFLQSESDDGYSYSLAQIQHNAQNAVNLGLLDGVTAATLARYRVTAWGR